MERKPLIVGIFWQEDGIQSAAAVRKGLGGWFTWP
jgi:hypothetical protein